MPKPTPKDTQALVKIKAFGLNRMDLLQREGMYPVPPQAPKTLGVEFSGTIEAEAANAESGFKVGDEVFGLAYGGGCDSCEYLQQTVLILQLGAYAEYIVVSTHMLIHKPKELSWETAAGIPEVSLRSYFKPSMRRVIHLTPDIWNFRRGLRPPKPCTS